MNHRQIYKIASKTVSVSYGVGPASKLLEQELALYERADTSADIVISINSPNKEVELLSRNPSAHARLNKGFSCDFGRSYVTWRKEGGIVYVDFSFDEYRTSWLSKFLDIQYNHPFEYIGQVFHEIVLVPTLFFFPHEVTLIHGSALETPEGKAILFAGTGGVGKTSLELELVLRGKHKFLADDICILDQKGNLWPNYAFPKIYGYNTIGNRGTETKLLQGRGILDRLQWSLKLKRSSYGVRRRVNPKVFYGGKIGKGSRLSKIFFLFRGQYSHFSVEPILSAERVATMNVEIIKAEYGKVFEHLHWHKFNSVATGSETVLDVSDLWDSWYRLQTKIFNSCHCYLIRIPLKSTVAELKDWVSSILN
jgi:hypothetical protein